MAYHAAWATAREKSYPYQLRHIPKPTVPLPIACRSVGHYRHPAGWSEPIKTKMFVEVFWGIKGQGRFVLRGEEHVLGPDDVFVLFTGDVHDIAAVSAWEYRWFTLDGEMPDAVVRSFGMGQAPFVAGPCPAELFERLSHEIEDISPQGQRAASATAYEVLTLAMKQKQAAPRSNAKLMKCIDLIRRNYSSPELNVTALAEACGVHRTNLSKLFLAYLSVSPVEYLILFRVGKAVKLLQDTDLPVGEVGRVTGFASANYFTNVIRKRTGLSPREIRERTAM